MLSLPLVLGVLLQAAGPIASGPGGYRPSGSSVDLHDLGRLARLRDPGVKWIAFHSDDRKGGSDDRSTGHPARFRTAAGASVLAEAQGAGVIQRMWFSRRAGAPPDGPGRDDDHLRIYLDGHTEPVLDIALEELFQGRHPHFPEPLVGMGTVDCVCYVPIAFRDGCQVIVDGLEGRSCRVDLVALPTAEGVDSFEAKLPDGERAHVDQAVRLWTGPGDLASLGLRDSEKAVYEVEALGRASLTYALPDGPRTVRSFEIIPDRETADAWRSARLRLVWDGHDDAPAGFDLPLGEAFGRADGVGLKRSVLVGETAGGWYLHAPMPYRHRARILLDTARPIRGRIRLWTVAGVEPDAGYLRARHVETQPSDVTKVVPLLEDRGRGHYLGLLLATEGRAGLPYRLGRDDRFEVDGLRGLRGVGPGEVSFRGRSPRAGPLERLAMHPSHGLAGNTDQMVGYRWYVADPIPYSCSLAAGLESGENDTSEARFRAAVFWYSEHPGPLAVAG